VAQHLLRVQLPGIELAAHGTGLGRVGQRQLEGGAQLAQQLLRLGAWRVGGEGVGCRGHGKAFKRATALCRRRRSLHFAQGALRLGTS